MEQFQKEKEELDRGCRECKRKVAECQRKLRELEVAEGEGSRAELERLQAEAQQLRKEERSWEQKLEEMRKKEKSMPWNVDTLSKDGFSKVGRRGAGGAGEGHGGNPHQCPPLICPKALVRGHTCHAHAPATLMFTAPPPPPPWTGWALRPRLARPRPRRPAASPQPTAPLAPPQSMVNVKPEPAEESEEAREQKHKTFVEKYEKQIKHFGELAAGAAEGRAPAAAGQASRGPPAPYQLLPAGMLRRWDDSQKYLSDNVHLVCEETANYLVIWCIDLEVEEVSGACPPAGARLCPEAATW